MFTSALAEAPMVRPRFITTDVFIWEGISILLSFEPDWFGLGAAFCEPPLAHLELQVLSPRGAPLPLADEGYWSDFFSPIDALEAGGAKKLAVALLNEFAETQTWRVRWARWEQLAESG